MRFTSIAPAGAVRLVAVAVVATMLAACGDETGILVRVSRDRATTDEIDEISVFVGVTADVTPIEGREAYLRDADDGDLYTLTRDLAEEPYQLLLTPGDGLAADEDIFVAVVGLRDGTPVAYGDLGRHVHFAEDTVAAWDLVLTGTEGGRLELTDTGCLKWVTDDRVVVVAPGDDRDCDDSAQSVDCDDTDPAVNPDAAEICGNDVDDNCDEVEDVDEDRDLDGVTTCGGDCDDRPGVGETVHEGALELCDAVDNDCNGVCDDGVLDRDEDRWNLCGEKILADNTCTGPDPAAIDCNDDPAAGGAAVNPGVPEVCNGVDDDCSLACDDTELDDGSGTLLWDQDGDDYTTCGSVRTVCDGIDPSNIDCDDAASSAFPGNEPEVCDGVDNDCDGFRFPADNTCFGRGGADECRRGQRACNDDAPEGQGGFADCQLGDEPAPDEACVFYENCPDPDPLTCVGGLRTLQCDVAIGPGGGLCPVAETELPEPFQLDGCVTTILVAPRLGWRVILVDDLGGSTGTTVPSCDVSLRVVEGPGPRQASDRVVVWHHTPETSQGTVEVILDHTLVAQCDPGGAMSCDGIGPN